MHFAFKNAVTEKPLEHKSWASSIYLYFASKELDFRVIFLSDNFQSSPFTGPLNIDTHEIDKWRATEEMTGLKNYLQQQMSLGTKKNSNQKTDTGSERCMWFFSWSICCKPY